MMLPHLRSWQVWYPQVTDGGNLEEIAEHPPTNRVRGLAIRQLRGRRPKPCSLQREERVSFLMSRRVNKK